VQQHHAFAALGYGGQLVEVVPDLDLVVVTTADVSDQVLDGVVVTRLVDEVIVPALQG
jgi:hypothetical protein